MSNGYTEDVWEGITFAPTVVVPPSGGGTVVTPPAVTTKAPTTTTTTPTKLYSNQLSAFGSPEAYAAGIKSLEMAGLGFQNPQAVAAFKADYPGLFQAPAAPTTPTTYTPPPTTLQPTPTTPTAAPPAAVTPPPGAAPTAPYAAHLQQYFGGDPYAYAAEIMRKEAAGLSFTDPAAAQAFKAAYPQLFQAAAPPEQPTLPPYIPPEMAKYAPPPVPYQQEMQSLLKQWQNLMTQPVRAEDYPGYQAMQEASRQQAAKASQQAMEILNQRGILNSTVTRDQVSEIEQQAMVQLMPRLFELAYGMRQDQISQLMNLLNTYSTLGQQEYQREVESQRWFYEQQVAQKKAALEAEEKKVTAAWDRVKTLGYVDNVASPILGLKVGTPSWEAKKAAQDRLDEIEKQKMIIQGQKEVAQIQQAGANVRAAQTAATKGQLSDYQAWLIQNATTNQQKQLVKNAIAAAQKDSRWPDAGDAPQTVKTKKGTTTIPSRQQIIDEYLGLLSGGTTQGMTPEQIKAELKKTGDIK